jgi:alkylhydroperoxidase family enzyme
MARLPYVTKADLAPADHDLLASGINLSGLLAHSPNAARRITAFARWVRFESRLDPRLRELALLQVGYLARSPYEYSHHIKIARDFGVGDDEIRAVAAETAGGATALEPLAKLVLTAAREMTSGTAMAAATFAALQASLDNERMLDLTATIAIYVGIVRLLGSLAIDVEPEYQRYLDEFPLPPA